MASSLISAANKKGMGVHAYALSNRNGNTLVSRQSRFFLNVLSPGSVRRSRRSALAKRLRG